MRHFKILAVLLCFAAAMFSGGCGSELATGAAGAAGGFAASETMKGIELDLANREQALIADYTAAVEAGAKQETLEGIESKIENTRIIKQGVETGKEILGVDWNDPTEAGGAIGLISTLAYAIFTGRKLKRTQDGVTSFMKSETPGTANKLDNAIRRKTGVT